MFSQDGRSHKEQSVQRNHNQAFFARLFIRHLIITQKTDNNAFHEASFSLPSPLPSPSHTEIASKE